MKNVIVYTDGACSGNPGPGGWAAILIYNQYRKEMKGFEDDTTNNKMELVGVIRGLEALTEPCEVSVHCDSAYVVDAIERGWIENWRENNWTTVKGSPVKNRELWEALVTLAKYHKLKFVKVQGHSDDEENNRCDELARMAILEFVNKPKKGAKKKAAPATEPPAEKAPAEKTPAAAKPAKAKAATSSGSAIKKKVDMGNIKFN